MIAVAFYFALIFFVQRKFSCRSTWRTDQATDEKEITARGKTSRSWIPIRKREVYRPTNVEKKRLDEWLDLIIAERYRCSEKQHILRCENSDVLHFVARKERVKL